MAIGRSGKNRIYGMDSFACIPTALKDEPNKFSQ
jgi:hypothetical protein